MSVPALSLLGVSRVYGNIIYKDCVGVGITFLFPYQPTKNQPVKGVLLFRDERA